MALSVALGFSGAIFNGIGLTLIIPLIMTLVGVEIVDFDKFPPVLRSIFQVFDSVPENYRLPTMIGCVVLAIIFKSVANYASALTTGVLNRRFSSSLRRNSYRLLLDVDLDYFSDMRLGDLMNYINNEVNRTATAASTLIGLTTTSITILVFTGILIQFSWKLTLITTLLLGPVTLINQFSLRQSKLAGRKISKAAAALSRHAIEVLSGIRLVKSVAHEEVEYGTLKKLVLHRERAAYESQLIFASVAPINEVSNTFVLITLVVIGRLLFSDTQVFASVAGSYLLVLRNLLPLVGQLNSARNKLANTSASVEIMQSFLCRDDKPIMPSGDHVIGDLKEGIRFRDVWFRYPNSERWNLQSINLVLPKGHTLALVGASGAGKSTMADLLARFYDPSEGAIEIDGVDLRKCGLHQYRKKIGIVSQETFLFNASVRDNIRYGCLNATDEAVFQAAKQANALEFIQNLPDGFDTLIGDRGVLLSGGQRQRLAIARALLQNPEILILDEATSALDTVSEKLVQQALEDLSKERTTLVIAHRLSTVQNADQIAALDQGKVVEVGTHQELLRKGGYYANLHSIQFDEDASAQETHAIEAEALQDDFSKVSFEIRSQLNGMMGLLGFLNEDMFEVPGEYEELTEQAYQSTLTVLQSLETLEKKVLPTA
ncbi:MAG: ABC transporter ATP-binding protein [Leptolyngbyaceae cyanobacterium]